MSVRSANRDLSELLPLTQKKVEAVMKEVGDMIFITEGYRSQERQDYLYAQGRTRPGKKVTRTKNSRHTKRQAVDIAFKGDALYPPLSDPRRQQVADVFKKHGFNRGGDRKKNKDYPHFEDNGEPFEEKLFYENLYDSFYGDLEVEKKVFKHPKDFAERMNKLSEEDRNRETAYLIAFLMQQLKDSLEK